MIPSRCLNQEKASAQLGYLAETDAASLSRADPLAAAAVEAAVGVLPEGTNVFIEPERLGNLASFPPVAAATSPDEGTDPAAPQRAA